MNAPSDEARKSTDSLMQKFSRLYLLLMDAHNEKSKYHSKEGLDRVMKNIDLAETEFNELLTNLKSNLRS